MNTYQVALYTFVGLLLTESVAEYAAMRRTQTPHRKHQRIIQSGLYARIRHPMYLGSILLFVGLPMVLASKSAWIFSVLGLIGLLIRIRKEESFLTEHFPGYRAYMERTWRLVPYLF